MIFNLQRAEKLETTNNLLVVKGPRFFTQLRHYTMQGMFAKTNKMELYTVKKGGTAVKLHEETVPINFVNLDFQGDVDYRDGLLCWTTTTKLLCGKWKRDSLNDITVVLSEGQASQVCRGKFSFPSSWHFSRQSEYDWVCFDIDPL